ncbi:MAG: hypothetical protein LBR68_00365 [Lachnoclostridium sp.]|jgi:hypothetical protein|nr:hypothetical protein [Lachnoclostridium sp.]
MIYKIYQTVSKVPPKGIVYTYPIFSKRIEKDGVVEAEPWLADGYYFWESFVHNAEHWGKTHCNNNYDIYCGEYDAHDPKCFNLVDGPECIKFICSVYKIFVEVKKRKPTLLNQILYFLLKKSTFAFPYDYVRVPADGGMINGIDLRFSDSSSTRYFLIRQIQVCFWKSRSELKNLVKYEKENPAENMEWVV